MDSNHPDKVMAFDALFTTNHIQMLKLLLGYLEPPLQGQLAVYIKFLELQYTLSFFRDNPYASLSLCQEGSGSPGDFDGLLEDMLPFCSAAEKEKLQNMRNMMNNLKNMQEMMEMVQMMQEVSPELFSGGGTDMSQMMEMMQGMFGTDPEK